MNAAAATPMSMTLAREVVNFDFAWRYMRGIEPRYQQCTFEQNVSYGVGAIWSGFMASDQPNQECCNECANRDECRAWETHGTHCFVKDNSDAKVLQDGRWSGRLGVPWPVNATEPAQAQLGFDDSLWKVVDAPHDMGASRVLHCERNGRRLSAVDDATFHNNCSGWYRKHFSVPAEWHEGVTWVYFEGVYHNSIAWLNGKRLAARSTSTATRHINGYTSFWHRLDESGLLFGEGERNVLTVYANAAPGTGWWYQGGGLTRHQQLVHTGAVFIAPNEAWVHSTFSSASTFMASGSLPAHGMSASGVHVVAAGVLTNAADEPAEVWVSADFTGATATSTIPPARIGPITIPAGEQRPFEISSAPPGAVQLWSVARPFLYTARLSVHRSSPETVPSDRVNVSFGVRHLEFDADAGMLLNQQHTKLR
jgi:hypothetical protein